MLLSRFWYVFLAVAATAMAVLALLGQAVINGKSDEALADSLQHDRAMANAMLRLEARSRLDRIAFITVDNKLGGLLRQAQGVSDDKKLREISAAVKDTLRAHVGRIVEAAGSGAEGGDDQKDKELEPDIAFALDGDGRIIAQLGPLEANPPGASLQTFPLVKRALQGYVRDDVWIYDRRVYRMAARPVMSGTEYAGAIVHGYRLDKGLPQKLAAYLGGATVAFFHGGDILGSQVPNDVASAPQPTEIAAVAAKLATDPKFLSGERNELMPLQEGGRAVLVPITGSAASAGVGYAIARPRKLLTSPEQLFALASQDDVKALPLPQLGGAAVLLAAIGLLFLYLERDRHMKQMLRKTDQIAAGERDRLIVTEWRGAYRKLADRINHAIDKEVEKAAERAPTTRKKANLDEILGPTPEASSAPFFGFASDPDAEPEAAAAASAPKATAAVPKAAVPASAAKAPTPSPLPAAAAPPLPVAAPPAAARPQAANVAPPPPVPRPAAAAATSPDNGAGFDEDAHFREVFEQYLATRKQCGEPIDNLTFEKFGVTLRKTRDQIVEKQGVKFVRFSVQVKEGKAALKAQPIKR
ncbi:MAG: MXAN_5187 family protein [Polyangiales bacterium]